MSWTKRRSPPRTVAVSAITMAELAAALAASPDLAERARQQDRLQRAEAAFEPIPFGGEAARAYGRVHAAVTAAGRQRAGGLRSRNCSAASSSTRPVSASHWMTRSRPLVVVLVPR